MIAASVMMVPVLASGMGPGMDVLLVLVPLFVAWVLAIVGGVVWWLVSLAKPFGWRWGVRRFLARTNLVLSVIFGGLLVVLGVADPGLVCLVVVSLVVAGMLGVPTTGGPMPGAGGRPG